MLVEVKASWHCIWQGFPRYDTKSTGKRIKIDKLDYIKINNLLCIKGDKKQSERQSMEWEIICKSYTWKEVNNKGI